MYVGSGLHYFLVLVISNNKIGDLENETRSCQFSILGLKKADKYNRENNKQHHTVGLQKPNIATLGSWLWNFSGIGTDGVKYSVKIITQW